MSNSKYGRHAPAFVLLFLAQEPAYGSILLNKMREQLPYNNLDSAAIYRALQELEKMKAVESYWDTTQPGPAKKWYKITRVGLKKLSEYRADIEIRKKNLEFFLTSYDKLLNKNKEDKR